MNCCPAPVEDTQIWDQQWSSKAHSNVAQRCQGDCESGTSCILILNNWRHAVNKNLSRTTDMPGKATVLDKLSTEFMSRYLDDCKEPSSRVTDCRDQLKSSFVNMYAIMSQPVGIALLDDWKSASPRCPTAALAMLSLIWLQLGICNVERSLRKMRYIKLNGQQKHRQPSLWVTNMNRQPSWFLVA